MDSSVFNTGVAGGGAFIDLAAPEAPVGLSPVQPLTEPLKLSMERTGNKLSDCNDLPLSDRECRDNSIVISGTRGATHSLTRNSFASLMDQIKAGKPFRELANSFIADIHEKKLDPGMPCMAETSGKITEIITGFLKSTWLKPEDKVALETYLIKVKKLEEEGFPYYESLKLSLLFPCIQSLYYSMLLEAQPDTEKREEIALARLDTLSKRLKSAGFNGNLSSLLDKPWELMFQNTASPEKDECVNIMSAFCNVLFGDRAFLKILQNKSGFVFIPSFAPFSYEMLNRISPVKVVFFGLTPYIYERHDNVNMSCSDLPSHDLWHPGSQWAMNMDGETDEHPYPGIRGETIDHYYEIRKTSPEIFNEYTEKILFSLVHEKGTMGEGLSHKELFGTVLNGLYFTIISLQNGAYKMEGIKSADDADAQAEALVALYVLLNMHQGSPEASDEFLLKEINVYKKKYYAKKAFFNKRSSFWELTKNGFKDPSKLLVRLENEKLLSPIPQLPFETLNPEYDQQWDKLLKLD